ncbi:hypothetical protein M378DRAFT_182678 [Amanita muscaria Koide BX008]|uniref:Uncharacterized protein n=1 Tax=Amanita muscaria (strain Koide BX008) TaxID=946122 RepID=A0A0C2WBU5_AMAMK|nr:hypothetical protein M378DRAFT_182678 [Amanita muscaria Koide BX008]
MAGANLDDKILDLKKQRMAVEKEIHEHQKAIGDDSGSKDRSRRLRTMISLKPCREGKLVLIYAVLKASWTPISNIRVDTQGSEIPVTPPHAQPLGYYAPSGIVPRRVRRSSYYSRSPAALPVMMNLTKSPRLRIFAASYDRTSSSLASAPRETDNGKYNVTVAQLDLDGTTSWVAVPKIDTKTRLSAKIKNASEFTLPSGVDSFIAKSDIPARDIVSPIWKLNSPFFGVVFGSRYLACDTPTAYETYGGGRSIGIGS